MSPEKILEVAESAETRILPEYRITTDRQRLEHLERQLDRACVLRCYSWLKERGLEVPSTRQR